MVRRRGGRRIPDHARMSQRRDRDARAQLGDLARRDLHGDAGAGRAGSVIDRVSPELALVDDALASDARLRLVVPEDILVLAPVVRLLPAPAETVEEGAHVGGDVVDERHEIELEDDVVADDELDLLASVTPLFVVPDDVTPDEELPDFLVLPAGEALIPVVPEGLPEVDEPTLTEVVSEDIPVVAMLEDELPDFVVLPEGEEAVASESTSSQYPVLPAPAPGLDPNEETEIALRLIRERFTADAT